MASLRFCMITTFYPPFSFGGDAIGIQRLSRALVQHGHQVAVLFDQDAYEMLNRNGSRRPDIEKDGVQLYGLRSKLGSISEFLTHQAGRPVIHRRRIRKILDEGRFDVITYHNVSLIGGPGILSMGSALKIYMAHEHWLVCPSHVLWRHDRELCDRKECIRCVLHYGRPPQVWRHTNYLAKQLKHVDAFIAMSDFSRKKHAEFGFERDMEVVPYFLPELPETADAGSPHHRPYFLFVGRLERIKGLDAVIPVYRDYRNADLLIAGDGEYEPELRRQASGIPQVQFLGRMNQDELNRYYKHAIALIVPSVCYETFGIILIEAFRQSTPVIAREIGPFPEILEQSGGGLLFRDGPGLISAMTQLQENPAARDEMGRMGRDGFRKYWSEQAVLPAFLDVVRRAAIQKNNTSVMEALS